MTDERKTNEKPGEGWNQNPVAETTLSPSERPLPSFTRYTLKGQKPPTEFTPERKQRFLEELARTGLRMHSAEYAGVTIATVRRHEKEDKEFADLAIEAKDWFTDGIEAEAVRRATEGYLEPVFSQKTGKQIGVVRKFSDRLLEIILKANRPDKFRENVQHEHKHSGGVLVVPGKAITDESWEQEHGEDAAGGKAPVPVALPFEED
jgi:hypothetical protein